MTGSLVLGKIEVVVMQFLCYVMQLSTLTSEEAMYTSHRLRLQRHSVVWIIFSFI